MNLDKYHDKEEIYPGIFKAVDEDDYVSYLVSKNAMRYFDKKFQEHSKKYFYDEDINGYRFGSNHDWVILAYWLHKRERDYFNVNNYSKKAYEMYLEYTMKRIKPAYWNMIYNNPMADYNTEQQLKELREKRIKRIKESKNYAKELQDNIMTVIEKAIKFVDEREKELNRDGDYYNLFSTANSYYHKKDYVSSIYFYIKFILEDINNFNTNRLSSLYNIGVSLLKLDNDLCKDFFHYAYYGFDKKEALYNLAYYYNKKGESGKAHSLLKRMQCLDEKDEDCIKALQIAEKEMFKDII